MSLLRAPLAPLFVASSLLSACATSAPVDELAGESASDQEVAGKADGEGTYTYYEVYFDQRRCPSPRCGGYAIKRAGRSTTTCPDRSVSSLCYVAAMDLASAGLSDEQQQELRDSVTPAGSGGTRVLVRGTVQPGTGDIAGYGLLVASEGWVSVNGPATTGVFARVKDTGARCIQAPCENKREQVLNGSRSAMLAELGWEDLGADDDTVTSLIDSTFHEGVIVVGSRFTVEESGRTAKGRTVGTAFRRLVPAP